MVLLFIAAPFFSAVCEHDSENITGALIFLERSSPVTVPYASTAMRYHICTSLSRALPASFSLLRVKNFNFSLASADDASKQ